MKKRIFQLQLKTQHLISVKKAVAIPILTSG